jgi:hypothetical protein
MLLNYWYVTDDCISLSVFLSLDVTEIKQLGKNFKNRTREEAISLYVPGYTTDI